MVAPRAAGVAFSADPVSGRRAVSVVSAVHGLGSALVGGETEADTWLIDRAGTIIERRVVQKDRMPCLSDEEVLTVVRLAKAAERRAGRPQDIEWAYADRLVLLQSRPITSLHTSADPDAPLTIWDNSNIVESYSGVTTPLTFSFARDAYEHVYQQFCRMMGVPERVITAREETFAQHARPGARPALLQPPQLVPHAGAPPRIPDESRVHGTDDGREGAAAA